MATVYLHIGAPKTATSTLQSVLAGNYRKLLANGVLYPRDCRHGDAHHLLVCDLIDKHQNNPMPDIWYGARPRGEAWGSLLAEMKQHEDKVETVILSSELFFGQARGIEVMLDDIATYLQGHEVKVLVYLRRQDQLYSSFYNQDVKGIRQWAYSPYEFYETHQMFQHDYRALLDIWSARFGKANVVIRPYESDQWRNGDILQDFCAATNIVRLTSGFRDENESLGLNQLGVKLCLNRVGYEKGDNAAVLKILMQLCPEEPVRGVSYINRGLYRRYREQWLAVNSGLADDYALDGQLFRKAIPQPEELAFYKPDRKGLAGCVRSIAAKIGKRKYARFSRLFARATLLLMAEHDLWDAVDFNARVALLELAGPRA
jgi:hypothetical protein